MKKYLTSEEIKKVFPKIPEGSFGYLIQKARVEILEREIKGVNVINKYSPDAIEKLRPLYREIYENKNSSMAGE